MHRRADGPASAVARAVLLLVALATLVPGAGCRSGRPTSGMTVGPGREWVITEDEIRAMSVSTAWDVVRIRAPRLIASRDAGGRPTGVSIQERRSLTADESPLLVVDGVQVSDLGWLAQIPASEVVLIRILDSEAAQPRYGLNASGGAIVVVTRGAQ